MVAEQELMDRVQKVLKDIDRDDFVKICNTLLGTTYTEDDIEWEN